MTSLLFFILSVTSSPAGPLAAEGFRGLRPGLLNTTLKDGPPAPGCTPGKSSSEMWTCSIRWGRADVLARFVVDGPWYLGVRLEALGQEQSKRLLDALLEAYGPGVDAPTHSPSGAWSGRLLTARVWKDGTAVVVFFFDAVAQEGTAQIYDIAVLRAAEASRAATGTYFRHQGGLVP